MVSFGIPIAGEVVQLKVPAEVATPLAQALIIQSGFHRRSNDPIRDPQPWAEKIAGNYVSASKDSERWTEQLATLARFVRTAHRRAEDSIEVSEPALFDRLYFGILEDATYLPNSDELKGQIRMAWTLVGHKLCLDDEGHGCDACHLWAQRDLAAFLKAFGVDPVIMRQLHTELVLANRLPRYKRPSIDEDPW